MEIKGCCLEVVDVAERLDYITPCEGCSMPEREPERLLILFGRTLGPVRISLHTEADVYDSESPEAALLLHWM